MSTQKEVPPRRTVESPDPPVALLAVDHARTPKPRPFPAEVTLRVFEPNRVIVLALFVRPVIGDGEYQPERPAQNALASRISRYFPCVLPLSSPSQNHR